MKRLWRTVMFCVALAGVIGGCGTVPVPPTPQAVVPPPVSRPANPKATLQERVTTFWEARLNDDIAQQYDFLEPAAKEHVLLTTFLRSQGTFQWQSYEVRSTNIVGEKAWVKVQYTFKLRIPQMAAFGPWTEESYEIWTLQDGVWYRPHKQEGAQTPPPETGRLDGSDFS